MSFHPDIESLLRKPEVTRPHDEFILPPVEPPAAPTEPVTTPSTQDVLREEAHQLQVLIEAIQETAAALSFPVRPQDQPLLGPVVTTADYVGCVRGTGQKCRQVKSNFEQGMLQFCGFDVPGVLQWPLLLLPDLTHLQDGLLTAAAAQQGSLFPLPQTSGASNLIGRALSRLPGAPGAATTGFQAPSLGSVFNEDPRGSQDYRAHLDLALAGMERDLGSNFLRCLLDPALAQELQSLQPFLQELLQILQTIQQALCVAMTLLAMELLAESGQLLNLILEDLLEQVLSVLGQLLGQAMATLVQPLLQTLLQGQGGHSPLECITDVVSHEIAQTLGEVLSGLIYYYQSLVADLIRTQRQQQALMLSKLGSLAKRSTIGRWMLQLEITIGLVRQLLSQPALVLNCCRE